MSWQPLWERIDPNVAIGRKVYGFAEVASTMDVAWGFVGDGAGHGTAVLAESQTQGRGRFGRHWISAPGESMSLSVVLHPPANVAPLLNIIACLVVTDAVRDVAGLVCTVKWPNDVEVSGRKLCGILTEARVSTTGDTVAVLGIGLNVDLDVAQHPELSAIATSLWAEAGRRYRMNHVALAVLAQLDRHYSRADRGEDLVADWKQLLSTLGERVRVQQRDRTLEGVAEDVDNAGRLLLRTDDGERHTLMEGDVTLAS